MYKHTPVCLAKIHFPLILLPIYSKMQKKISPPPLVSAPLLHSHLQDSKLLFFELLIADLEHNTTVYFIHDLLQLVYESCMSATALERFRFFHGRCCLSPYMCWMRFLKAEPQEMLIFEIKSPISASDLRYRPHLHTSDTFWGLFSQTYRPGALASSWNLNKESCYRTPHQCLLTNASFKRWSSLFQ